MLPDIVHPSREFLEDSDFTAKGKEKIVGD
jgi:hypothetical protein